MTINNFEGSFEELNGENGNGQQEADQVINKDAKAAVEQMFPGKFVKETEHWFDRQVFIVGKDEGARERVVARMASGPGKGVFVRASCIQPSGFVKPILILEEVMTADLAGALCIPQDLMGFVKDCCKDSSRPLGCHLYDPSGTFSKWTDKSTLAVLKRNGDYTVDVNFIADLPEELEDNPVFLERLKAKVEEQVREVMPASFGKLNVTFDGSDEALKKLKAALANGQSVTLDVSKGDIPGNLILREPKKSYFRPRYKNRGSKK